MKSVARSLLDGPAPMKAKLYVFERTQPYYRRRTRRRLFITATEPEQIP